jgi:hypothetical protein
VRSIDKTAIGIRPSSEANAKTICVNVDSSISAWLSLLPKPKRLLVDESGSIDYHLLKAHLTLHVSTISKHRYLSALLFSQVESISSCAPPPPPEPLLPIYAAEVPIHTAKILHSILKMTEILTLPISACKLSPFSTCIIAAVTIAHLSACRHVLPETALESARERVRVAIGTIETFAEVWPRAKQVVKEIKAVAKDSFRHQSSENSSPGVTRSTSLSSFQLSEADSSLSPDDPIRYFDQAYFSGFDSGLATVLASDPAVTSAPFN